MSINFRAFSSSSTYYYLIYVTYKNNFVKYFFFLKKALYGKKTPRKPTVFGKTNSVPLNEIDTDVNEIENDSPLCSDPKIGAIVTMEDNSTYVFKGKQYYKLTDDSVEDGYPRDIARDWDGLPGKSR